MNINTSQEDRIFIPVDVCWFLKEGSDNNDWEFKYSLRSIEDNFSDLGDVWIIGGCPSFINQDKVKYIWFPNEPTQNKDRNLIQKLAYLSGEIQLTEDFIINSDDHFVLKQLDISQFLPYIEGPLPYKWGQLWERRYLRTKATLEELGFTGWNYDTHTPQLVNKTHCRELLKYNFDGVGMCVFSLYFNTLLSDRNPTIITQKARFDARGNFNEIADCDFCIANDGTAENPEFIKFIENKFPNKSSYEL